MANLISMKSSNEDYPSGNGFSSSDFSSRTNLCSEMNNTGKQEKFGIDNLGMEKDNNLDCEKGKEEPMGAVVKAETLKKKDEIPVKKGPLRQYGGMGLTLLASMLFSFVTLMVKILHQRYGFDPEDASFWRYAGITVPSIPILIYFESCKAQEKKKSPSVFDSVWPLDEKWRNVVGLVARGILGGFSVIFRYLSLAYLSIGDTSVISYSSPILVTILAHFLLGEKTGIVPIFSTILALCGVIVITQPPILTGQSDFDTERLIGTGFACGSLVCSALMTIITRKIREVQFALMLVVFGIIGMIEAVIFSQVMNGFSLPEGLEDSLLLVGVAGLSFVGQMSIILALKFEQAGPVALIRTCDVVFGFLFQFVFMGVVPNIYSAIGGSVVFCGILITATRKYVSTLPPEHGCRRAFRFLLY